MVMPGIQMVTLIISVTEKHEFGQDTKKKKFFFLNTLDMI